VLVLKNRAGLKFFKPGGRQTPTSYAYADNSNKSAQILYITKRYIKNITFKENLKNALVSGVMGAIFLQRFSLNDFP